MSRTPFDIRRNVRYASSAALIVAAGLALTACEHSGERAEIAGSWARPSRAFPGGHGERATRVSEAFASSAMDSGGADDPRLSNRSFPGVRARVAKGTAEARAPEARPEPATPEPEQPGAALAEIDATESAEGAGVRPAPGVSQTPAPAVASAEPTESAADWAETTGTDEALAAWTAWAFPDGEPSVAPAGAGGPDGEASAGPEAGPVGVAEAEPQDEAEVAPSEHAEVEAAMADGSEGPEEGGRAALTSRAFPGRAPEVPAAPPVAEMGEPWRSPDANRAFPGGLPAWEAGPWAAMDGDEGWGEEGAPDEASDEVGPPVELRYARPSRSHPGGYWARAETRVAEVEAEASE